VKAGDVAALVIGGLMLWGLYLVTRRKKLDHQVLVYSAADITGPRSVLPSPVDRAGQVRVIARATLVKSPDQIGAGNPWLVGQGTSTPELTRLGWVLFWFGNGRQMAIAGIGGGNYFHINLEPVSVNEAHTYDLIFDKDGLLTASMDGRELVRTSVGPIQVTAGESLNINQGDAFHIQELALYV